MKTKKIASIGFLATLATMIFAFSSVPSRSFASDQSVEEALIKLSKTSSVIQSVKATPTNGGFNPDYFAYVIEGRVELGSNKCLAHGRSVSLKSTTIGRTVIVYAQMKRSKDEANRMCTMEYAPVFTNVKGIIRGASSMIDTIIIVNANTAEHLKSFRP